MFYLKLVTIVLVTTFSTSAFAWTWTCNPKETNAVAAIPPPKINLMVDKSGSMGPDWGIFEGTCKVCEKNGYQFPVDLYEQCLDDTPTNLGTVVRPRNSGSAPTYNFSIPVAHSNSTTVALTVTIQGDYSGYGEHADVFVAGQNIGRMFGGGADCSAIHKKTFFLDRSSLPPGNLPVSVQASPYVGTFCAQNRTSIAVGGMDGNYLGTQTNNTVCGVSKWEIATASINSLTDYSDGSVPELAHFGLGLYSGNSANNLTACASQNHDAIAAQLAANAPFNGTPTSVAIRESLAGSCFTNAATEPTATVVVTDGTPNNKTATVEAACLHRNVALVYAVGLGDGTDTDFNNILAAAGGTGTCELDKDPCDQPQGWPSLRNKCEGSIQTSNQSQLTAAIGGISANLGCSFKINFSGTIRTSVPTDGSSRYEYLYVDYTDAAGNPLQIYHQDSSLASDINNDGVKDGWTFVDVNRDYVKFSDAYCARIQTGSIVETATQLACLCDQPTGDECDVPNYEANGVCPTGIWQCSEGVDWCEPEANCCVDGESCTVPGAEGICAQGAVQCPVDSGIDGAIPDGSISFLIDSDNPDDRTKAHVLESISIEGVTYADFLAPDSYSSSFDDGKNMYISRNGTKEEIYADDAAAWAPKALPAFRSRNLGFYQGNDSEVKDDLEYYTLSYNEPVIVTSDRFVSFTERHSNNPVNIQALDSSGNPLGGVLKVLTSHYVGTGHRTSGDQEIGIATYALDDLAPVGSKIASIRVYPLSYGANNAADGKLFIFGNIPTNADGSGASSLCVSVVDPETEVCDGLDNDCDGVVDELDNTDCTVPGLKGRCAAGQLACTNSAGTYDTVCIQNKFPMPELCDGLDNDCNGQEDDISKSWKKPEFQTHKQSLVNPEDRGKACDFEDVCICNNGAMDDHAGSDFMSYVAEWDPACVCRAALEEDPDYEIPEVVTEEPVAKNSLSDEEESNSSDTAVVGCSATGNGSGSVLFLILGFFLFGRRRK